MNQEPKVLRVYEENGLEITEYTRDGINVSHTVEVPIQVETIEPVEPVETTDDKLNRLEQQLQEQEVQNLILVDINLTVYEELLNLKDQLSTLTGSRDDA